MDGSAPKKSASFETLIIQNISNVNDLKNKLNEIIESGKYYEYDVSSCLKTLIQSDDQTIVLLTVQAISEIVKCEIKRETYALTEIIEPILMMLKKDITVANSELAKQCLRALGNLCCDCDTARDILLKENGVSILADALRATLDNSKLSQIKLLTCKTLLNFAIGGQKYSELLVKENIIELLRKILTIECYKDCMDDDEVTTALLLLSVVNDNDPQILYDEDVNKAVLKVLEEASSVEVSELCLELLHSQAENDSVKTLLAKESGVQLVCQRLEQLIDRLNTGNLNADAAEIEPVMKQACDLIIIVLTGGGFKDGLDSQIRPTDGASVDEAMDMLYKKGSGEVYKTMVRWLDSRNYQLLTTGTLAIGNFARRDDYCVQMMESKIFDKLLGIFEKYHKYGTSPQEGGDSTVDEATANKVQHAALAALRNLSVPARNKRPAARAAPALVAALPAARDPRLADQLLAALRLLLDEECAVSLSESSACLTALGTWGRSPHARASAEASRLLARAARLLPPEHRARIAAEEECVASLVSMMVAPHSLMQSEALLALTLLGAAGSDRLAPRLATAELGRHAALLVDTNCTKMPPQVAENLVALLEVCGDAVADDCGRAGVSDALRRLLAARDDLSPELRARLAALADRLDRPDRPDQPCE